jgi:hypothetical protein
MAEINSFDQKQFSFEQLAQALATVDVNAITSERWTASDQNRWTPSVRYARTASLESALESGCTTPWRGTTMFRPVLARWDRYAATMPTCAGSGVAALAWHQTAELAPVGVGVGRPGGCGLLSLRVGHGEVDFGGGQRRRAGSRRRGSGRARRGLRIPVM